ncbi:hypothetical protein ACFLU6_10065 [Acidobacteriota bacterium]
MDFFNLIYDKLITVRTSIKSLKCRRQVEGEGYYCTPSGKYARKTLFAKVCPHVDIMTLDPDRLRECACRLDASKAVIENEDKPAEMSAEPEAVPQHDGTADTKEPAVRQGVEEPGDREEPLGAKAAEEEAVPKNAPAGREQDERKADVEPGKDKKDMQEPEAPKDNRFRFSDLKHIVAPNDWITISGEIINLTDDKFRFISLEISYFDQADAELTRNVTIVSNLEPKSGKTIKFSKKVSGFDHFTIDFRNIIQDR